MDFIVQVRSLSSCLLRSAFAHKTPIGQHTGYRLGSDRQRVLFAEGCQEDFLIFGPIEIPGDVNGSVGALLSIGVGATLSRLVSLLLSPLLLPLLLLA